MGPAALAADLLPPPVPAFTWTGPYIGAQIGYGWGSGSYNAAGFDPVNQISFNASSGGTPSGVAGGAHVGYQYQINQWVIGVEGSVDGSSLSSAAVAVLPAFGGSILTADTSLDVAGTIRGKLGITWDRVLIYGTGGAAFGGFSTNLTLTSFAAGGTPFILAGGNASNNRVGWTAGGGLQYAVTDNWWVFVEYRYTNFGSVSANILPAALPAGAFVNGSRQIRENQVQAGFSYRFNIAPPPPPVIAKY
jgi:outer membrane immunogenic protein